MVQGLGADMAGAYARSDETGQGPWAAIIFDRTGAVCRHAGFVAASPASARHILYRVDPNAGGGLVRVHSFGAADCRCYQHHLRIPVLPVAWLANTRKKPAARLLEDRRPNPDLLGHDVLRRMAGSAAVVATPFPLGKDTAQTGPCRTDGSGNCSRYRRLGAARLCQ